MPTLQQQIRAGYQRLADRPLPTRWIRMQPDLVRYPNPAALVGTIRDPDRPTDADQIVRALAAISHEHTDAGTVLLEALAWGLSSGMNRRLSAEFRDEILVELSIVILDAQDLDQLDKLASRLVRRAQARARRRHRMLAANRDRELQVPPAELRTISPVDVAQLATDRAHLTTTLCRIRGHLDSGRLSQRSWEDCRDGYLVPAIGGPRLQRDRSRTYRGRQAVKAVLAHAY
jgi:hypothetical protein